MTIISLDANFGLVRKKSAGNSLAMPNHLDLYFIEQDVVDERLEELPTGSANERTKVGYKFLLNNSE